MIRVTNEFGLILRREALVERGVSMSDVLTIVRADQPLDESDRLVSFGPCFGKEALESIVKSLETIGLLYIDDFVEFFGDYPPWLRFWAEFTTEIPENNLCS